MLFFSTRVVFTIYTSQYLYIGGILAALSVTLLASLAAAFFIDQLVVVTVEAVYDRVVEGGRWVVKKVGKREVIQKVKT